MSWIWWVALGVLAVLLFGFGFVINWLFIIAVVLLGAWVVVLLFEKIRE